MDLEARSSACAPRVTMCSRRRSMAAASATHSSEPGSPMRHTPRRSPKLFWFEDLKDVVIVGTSSGGMVMARFPSWPGSHFPRRLRRRAGTFRRREDPRHRQGPTTAIDTPLALGPTREDADGRLFAGLDAATRELGRRPRDAASCGRLQAAGEARKVLGPAVESLGALLQSGAQPRRGAYPPRRDKLKAQMACDRHGSLPDAEHAR